MSLTETQVNFMRELRERGNLKISPKNKTANALAQKGLIHFVVYFGWVPTEAGLMLNLD